MPEPSVSASPAPTREHEREMNEPTCAAPPRRVRPSAGAAGVCGASSDARGERSRSLRSFMPRTQVTRRLNLTRRPALGLGQLRASAPAARITRRRPARAARPRVEHWPSLYTYLGYCLVEPALTLGEQLRRWRRAQGLCRSAVAQLLGLDDCTLWRLEAGITGEPTRRVRSTVQSLLARPLHRQ